MEGKKSFILYSDLIEVVKELPIEKRGELFTIILEYVNDMDPKIDDPMLRIAFAPIKLSLKRDLEKWLNVVKRNQENGKKGGRPKKNPKEPTGFSGIPKEPKKADNVNDTDIDTDTEKKLHLDFSIDSVRVQEATKKIADFFGIGEISQATSYIKIGNFVRYQEKIGNMELLAKQFTAYRKAKEKNGFKHSWMKYIGSPEKSYEDGAWNIHDWSKQIKADEHTTDYAAIRAKTQELLKN